MLTGVCLTISTVRVTIHTENSLWPSVDSCASGFCADCLKGHSIRQLPDSCYHCARWTACACLLSASPDSTPRILSYASSLWLTGTLSFTYVTTTTCRETRWVFQVSFHTHRRAGSSSALNGCVNDVASIKAMLIEYYGFSESNIVTLIDTDPASVQPTGKNIKDNLTKLVAASATGDVLVFHFSGHGTQVRCTFDTVIAHQKSKTFEFFSALAGTAVVVVQPSVCCLGGLFGSTMSECSRCYHDYLRPLSIEVLPNSFAAL